MIGDDFSNGGLNFCFMTLSGMFCRGLGNIVNQCVHINPKMIAVATLAGQVAVSSFGEDGVEIDAEDALAYRIGGVLGVTALTVSGLPIPSQSVKMQASAKVACTIAMLSLTVFLYFLDVGASTLYTDSILILTSLSMELSHIYIERRSAQGANERLLTPTNGGFVPAGAGIELESPE